MVVCSLSLTVSGQDETKKNYEKEINRQNALIQELQRKVEELEAKGASKGSADNDELKKAQAKISQLEEDLFIAKESNDDGDDEEEGDDEGTGNPYADRLRRLPVGILFPRPGTIGKGQMFARISHVGRESVFTGDTDEFHDFLGIESDVKIGIMFGYGIVDGWDLMIQRTNGRSYRTEEGDSISYDLWDIMTKVRVLNEVDHGIDASVMGGVTYFLEDNDNKDDVVSGNGALLLGKSFWRFRLGTGLLYASQSTFERTLDTGSMLSKRHPNEQHSLSSQSGFHGPSHTLAVPINLDFSFSRNTQLFMEVAIPIEGYETEGGPSGAIGYRYSTSSHSYDIFLSNSANNSFNSTFTGGDEKDRLNVFGFAISIFF